MVDHLNPHNIQADVEDFMQGIGQTLPGVPSAPTSDVLQLRIDLITEEFDELIHELVELQHRPETAADELLRLSFVAKEAADLVYVVIGTASALGIDLEPVWEAVQESNMQKVSGPVRDDGKRLKPEGYRPPNILGVIREQVAERDFADRSIK
jgi:predicted HAD superfamily Cof-like phosphohydrolase